VHRAISNVNTSICFAQPRVLHKHVIIIHCTFLFSDERAMKRVVPQLFQDNAELYEKVVEVSAQLLLPDTHMI